MQTKYHYHIVGVAGTGMSALAQAMVACGCSVSGSDRYLDQNKGLQVLDCLQRVGVELCPQNGSGVSETAKGLVVSSAIEDDNPDVLAAASLDIPIIHRAVMLNRLIGDSSCIAIAGTSGKTTVTGMTGWLLEQCGADPFVVNGGAVIKWENSRATGSVRPSDSGTWVIEADESDRSFLNFTPAYAIITNISHDHFSLEESIALFNTFAQRITQKIVCTPSVSELLTSIPSNRKCVVTPQLQQDSEGWFFVDDKLVFRTKQPGRHNAENAFLAVTLCKELGMPTAALQQTLRSFPGIRRRMEYKGGSADVHVYDDYAHNPEKIRAAWVTLKETHPTVVGIWKPHGFKPLASMGPLLAEMFCEVVTGDDSLHILPVYYAGGTTTRSLTSLDFVKQLRERGINAHYAESYDSLLAELPRTMPPPSCILCMGARDPDLPRFSQSLAQRFSQK